MLPDYKKLCVKTRFSLEQEVHDGLVLTLNSNGEISKIGNDNNYPFSWRSCMKHLQLAALYEIVDYFDLSEHEIAVACSSHAGEDFHVEAVRSILKKANIGEDKLLCPAEPPIDKSSYKNLIRQNKTPLPVHNNCSGKHAAILAYCKMKNINLENYLSENHPVNRHIISKICKYTELNPQDLIIGTDGCKLPVIAAPLKNLAKGVLKVILSEEYRKIADAIVKYPEYNGGTLRADSLINKYSEGKIIAKTGAGNIATLTDTVNKECTVIKVSNPDNNARNAIMVEFLRQKKILTDKDANSIFQKLNLNSNEEKFEFIRYFPEKIPVYSSTAASM